MKLMISKRIYVIASLLTFAYLSFLIFSNNMGTYNFQYCPPGTYDYCSWNLKYISFVVVPRLVIVFALSLAILVMLKKIYEYAFKKST